MSSEQKVLGTRAVIRPTEAGKNVNCAFCHNTVKFVAKNKGRHVIANIYVDEKERPLPPGVPGGTWRRVEHFHFECYEEAGEPHGSILAAASQPEVKEHERRRAVSR